jgi:hypothetical protein
MTRTRKDQGRLHRPSKFPRLLRDLLLVFPREIYKVVILCPHQERDRSLEPPISQPGPPHNIPPVTHRKRIAHLIESPSLPVPFLDAVESALPRQVKHEEDRDGVVAHEW